MRRYLLFFILAMTLTAVGCNRKSGCPSYNKKTGEYRIKPKKKSSSNLFPKNMRKEP